MTKAWHGDPGLKAEVVESLKRLRDEGRITREASGYQELSQGTGYRCTLIGALLPPQRHTPDSLFRLTVSKWYETVEQRCGIITEVGHLLETVFSLHPGSVEEFAVAAVTAIPVGASLDLVPDRLILDLLSDPVHGAVTAHPIAAVRNVAALYRRRVDGDEPDDEDWRRVHDEVISVGASPLVSNVSWIGTRTYYTADTYALAAESAADSDEVKRWLAARLVHHLSRARNPQQPRGLTSSGRGGCGEAPPTG